MHLLNAIVIYFTILILIVILRSFAVGSFICGDCGHATDVKDDAFAEELLQLEVFHAPCKGTEGKGVMRRGGPFKHIANASVRPLYSESTSEDNNALVDLGYYFTQTLDTLINVSAYIFAAFFTGSKISLNGPAVGVCSKKFFKCFFTGFKIMDLIKIVKSILVGFHPFFIKFLVFLWRGFF